MAEVLGIDFTKSFAIMHSSRRVALDTRVVFGFNLRKKGSGYRDGADAGYDSSITACNSSTRSVFSVTLSGAFIPSCIA